MLKVSLARIRIRRLGAGDMNPKQFSKYLIVAVGSSEESTIATLAFLSL